MNVLIGADGTSWESAVARRFEKAVWYLIVNSETLEREVYQNVYPHDRNNILLLASRRHVPVILGGGMDAATARLMLSLNLRFVIVTRANVRRAVDLVNTAPLHVVDLARFSRGAKTVLTERGGTPLSWKRVPAIRGRTVASGSTLRGHHHLQQYGGRGH